MYEKVSEALLAAANGGTVKLLKDADETYLTVNPGVTLDLDGKTLTANFMVGFNGSNVVDSSAENSGLLKCSNVVLAANNSQLPVWTGDGYVFVQITRFQEMHRTSEDGRPEYVFIPTFEPIAHSYLLNGAENSKVNIAVAMDWITNTGTAYQNFVYSDNTVNNVIGSYNGNTYGRVFSAVVASEDLLGLEITAVLISDTGVEMVLTAN